VHGGSFQQRRRSLPLEQAVFEAFPELFKKLITFVKGKLHSSEAEIRFGLVVRSTDAMQKKRMQERIKKLATSMGSQLNESVVISALYNSDDEDKETVAVGKGKGLLSGLSRKDSLSDAVISESKMSEVSITQPGAHSSRQVKIIDKSKRAYDCSIESTRALEIAIMKEGPACCSFPSRIRAVLYSTWILLFKYHGKPPGHSLNFWFLVFSATLTTEILLTAVFLLHVSSPAENFWSFGLPFLLFLPAVPLLAPLTGLFAVLTGSPESLKVMSSMNATLVLVNYPLTVALLLLTGQPTYYTALLLLLCLNKVVLSLCGSKVR